MGTQSVHVKFRKTSLLGRLKTSGAPVTKTKLTMSFEGEKFFFSIIRSSFEQKQKVETIWTSPNLWRGIHTSSSDLTYVLLLCLNLELALKNYDITRIYLSLKSITNKNHVLRRWIFFQLIS